MTLEQTIQSQQNRISELEQQIELVKEAHLRLIDNMLTQVNHLQEQVERLLDPDERTLCAQENPNEP